MKCLKALVLGMSTLCTTIDLGTRVYEQSARREVESMHFLFKNPPRIKAKRIDAGTDGCGYYRQAGTDG